MNSKRGSFKVSEEPDRETAEVESIITFSTHHITRHDDVLLTRRACTLDERLISGQARREPFVEGPIVFAYDTGVFVRLSDETFAPDADESDNWKQSGYSSSLVLLLKEAWKFGHRWVRFDAGGPVVNGFATFDW